jgi:hypothetical protein
MPSVYNSLPLQGKQIRLLHVEATSPQIICNLQVASLDDSMAFDALSYLWGDPSLVTPVIVNGEEVQITNNLAEALRYIIPHWQREHPDRSPNACRLWADALCIDQSSTAEKNHQVPLMHDIYTRAERVYCWLGPPSKEIDLAFDAMNTIRPEVYLKYIRIYGVPNVDFLWRNSRLDVRKGDGAKLANLVQDFSWIEKYPLLHMPETGGDPEASGNLGAWMCLNRMATLAYWKRVWIYQELTLAKHPVFICGAAHTSFEAIISTRIFIDEIRYNMFTNPNILRFFNKNAWLSNFLGSARTNWDTIEAVFHAREGFHTYSLSWSCLRGWLLSNNSTLLEATDPRDHYYGLVAVSRLALVPDYTASQSVARVACEYFKNYLQMYQQFPDDIGLRDAGPLFFLQWSGMGNGWTAFAGMPSWAPNYPGIAQSRGETGKRIIVTKYFDIPGLNVGVFDKYREIKIAGASLRVPAMRLDSIKIPTQAPDHACGLCLKFRTAEASTNEFGKAACQVISLIHSRPGGNVDGTHMLLIVEQLVTKINNVSLRQSTDFLLILFTVYKRIRLKRLDAMHGLEFVYEFLFLLHLGDLAKTLTFASQGLPRELDFYATMPKKLGNDHSWPILAAEILKWPIDLAPLKEACKLLFKEPSRLLAETRSGYIGYFPEHTQEGDEVFLLQGSHVPSVLRKRGDHYLHVGICFVAGMTAERVEELANSGKSSVEMVEIR